MKEGIIKAGVLTAVFIIAVIVFSFLTNKNFDDMTVDMDAASFPTMSFHVEGYEVNTLMGYKNEMNIPMVRDAVTLLDSDGSVQVNIQSYEQQIKTFTYEIYSLDDTEKLFEKTEKKIGETLKLETGETLTAGTEAVLKITLQTENEDAIHYYTRVKKPEQYYTKECLDFVKDFHTNVINNENANEIKSFIESNEEGNNKTYGHVTIHSDLKHVMWGDLNPRMKNKVRWSIKETNEVYTAIQLKYQVTCKGDDNEEETYNVKEFFRVRYVNDKIYLLGYDRTMDQVFDGAKKVLSGKGVNLGVASERIPYMTNNDGTIAAFVKERELWCYDKKEDTLACVFSFEDSGKEDLRNLNDQHAIHILSMDSNGNMTFGVYGYMNRGMHEGEVGAAIYYYNLSHHTVEEKVFIPSNKCFKIVEEELGKLAYYNEEQDIVYLLLDGNLCKIHVQEARKEVLVEELSDNQYVVAADGHLLAYRNGQEIIVMDLKAGKEQTVKAEDGLAIQPLGFIGNDLVYGLAKEEDAGKTASGNVIQPMYKLLICDFNGNVLKTYEEEGVYVKNISVDDNMITLNRVVKSGGTYRETAKDYITNHADKSDNNISLQTYITELKETQYRLEYESVIEDKKPKVLRPKQVLAAKPMELAFENEKIKEQYYVYGMGEMLGAYDSAGEAVRAADEVEGVVTSWEQVLVWESGNKHAWYRNFEIGRFTVQSGENGLQACLRHILNYEGAEDMDLSEASDINNVIALLNDYPGLTGVNLTGCSIKELCHLVGKGAPVIALTDSSSGVLLIGYDAQTVTYADPVSGSIKSCTFEKMEEMTGGSGNVYIGYIKTI